MLGETPVLAANPFWIFKKIGLKSVFGQPIFWLKKFFGQKFWVRKKCWVRKIFWVRKISGKEKFWVKNILGSKFGFKKI